jgi:hypothetical protein
MKLMSVARISTRTPTMKATASKLPNQPAQNLRLMLPPCSIHSGRDYGISNWTDYFEEVTSIEAANQSVALIGFSLLRSSIPHLMVSLILSTFKSPPRRTYQFRFRIQALR